LSDITVLSEGDVKMKIDISVFETFEEAREEAITLRSQSGGIFEVYEVKIGWVVLESKPRRIYTVGEILEDGSKVIEVSYDGTECLVSYGDC
jgi:hypothetical protein